MEEQLREITEQMELIIEKVNKLEDIVMELQEQVNKLQAQRTEQTGIKQNQASKACISLSDANQKLSEVKESINRFIDKARELTDEEVEKAIETYSNKLRQYYIRQDFAEENIQKMKYRVEKARQASYNSAFVVKDEWKVYFQIEDLGYKGSLGIALQEINNNLHIKIPKEQTEQAKQYYFHCLKKAYQGSYTEDQLKRVFNKFVADFPID